MIHVSMIFLNYATLLCGSLSSISLLVIAYQINQKILNQKIFLNVKNSFFFNWYSRDQEKKELKQNFYLSPRNYHKWVFTHQLDQLSYHTIGLGFSLLAIGILSRAVWANEAWDIIGVGIQKKLGH